MLTARGAGLLGAAAGLWALSRAFGVPELGMAAMGALVLVIIAVVYTRLASATVTAERWVHPPRLFHDAAGSVELKLTNHGRLPTAIVGVEDAVPSGVGDQARFVVSPIGPGRRVTIRYPLQGRLRGRYELGPLVIRLRDPFGVAARPLQLGATSEVLVYPPVWRLPPGMPLGGHQESGGEGQPRPLARGDELANVREYVRGDDLRKVHWRSTAHRGKLMVRQDEAPQHPRATLVLDLCESAHAGVGARSSLESVVTAGASIAYHLAERSFATRLVTAPLTAPPPAVSWRLVLDQLAEVEPLELTSMDPIWQQLATGVGGEGTLIAVTTVPDATALRRMVRAGRGFGARIALLVDADSFTRRPRNGPEHAPQMAAALQVAGWRVGVVRAGDRLDAVWQEVAVQRRGQGVSRPASKAAR